MFESDIYALCFAQLVILLMTIVGVIQDFRVRRRERVDENRPGVQAKGEVIRGDKSMTSLIAVYVTTIAACAFLLDQTSVLNGNKVSIMIINFVCLTYLFFFNNWFRNSVFFPLSQRVRKD